MIVLYIIITNLLFIAAEVNLDTGYCDAASESCRNQPERNADQKLIFYDVNPPEGFNLRRDVYMRFAIMIAEAHKRAKMKNWKLVLPPWNNLYHWKTESKPMPWGSFFDIGSLKSYAPVVELYEVFPKTSKYLDIDTLYVLKNYEDAFENGVFTEKWEIDSCDYHGDYWGYENITAKEVVCVKFQGKISKIKEIIASHHNDRTVMFAHGEIPLHDAYGTKSFWDCRKSMRFNQQLVEIANSFISQHFDCEITKCNSYISVHWRRGDFARSRGNDVPSIKGTVNQIHKVVKTNKLDLKNVFIASDCTTTERKQIEEQLVSLGYKVYFFKPDREFIKKFTDGGAAIIDQIICSHSSYFVGTHDSTFTYRIQEEREIFGFDPTTTFNRLCPDKGKCEKPSMWRVKH